MANKVKFISIDLLREQTSIQDNVDADTLLPSIYKAHDINLQQALGSTFYNRLKQGVIDNDLNADEISLIDTYIQPMMIEWSFYYALRDIKFKPTNKSLSEENSEYSNSVDLDSLKYFRNEQRNHAEYFTSLLIKYLCEYDTLFPEYNNPDDKETVRKSDEAYFSGLYLGGKEGKKYDRYHKKWVD